MGNLNKVLLIGRLGKEPEPKKTQSGKTVLNITLASSEFYKDQSGSRQERTEWHRVVLWEKVADVVANYCHKGSQLFVEGKLQTRDWQDKEGNKRYTTEILGRNIQLLDPKGQGQGQRQASGSEKESNYPDYPSGGNSEQKTVPFDPSKDKDEFVEDDIPF